MFQEGDIVQLKSGGPQMTVTHVIGSGSIADVALKQAGHTEGDVCVQFFAGNELKKATFNQNAVTKA